MRATTPSGTPHPHKISSKASESQSTNEKKNCTDDYNEKSYQSITTADVNRLTDNQNFYSIYLVFSINFFDGHSFPIS
jgi:hypothetical protein